MSKKRAGLLALAFLAWSGFAHALGLGEIEVRSRLNQPLSAVIPVSATQPGELEGVIVELAGNEEFERYGLERPEFLSSLRFAVQGNTIVVSSKQIAREPFVSFLLDVRWAGGRLLREYTVLLDPPVMAQQPQKPAVVARPAPAEPGIVQAPAPMAQAEPSEEMPAGMAPAEAPMEEEAPASETADAAAPAAEPARMSGDTYGPVAPKETLWSIAYQLRPDTSLTMDQMQVAIFNANPQAFHGGSLTGLMKGVTLRVPAIEEIRAVDPVAAKAQVAAAREGHAAAMAAPAPAPTPAPATRYEPEPAPAPAEPLPEAEVEAAPVEEPVAEEVPAEAAPSEPMEQAQAEPAPEEAPAEAPPEEAIQTEPTPAPTAAAPAAEDEGLVAELVERGRSLVDHPLFFPAAAGIVVLLLLLVSAKWFRSKYAQWSYDRALRKAPVAGAGAAAEGGDEDATQVSEPSSMEAALEEAAAEELPPVAATQAMGEPALEATAQATMQQTLQQTQVQEPPLAQSGGQAVDFDVTGSFADQTVQINLDAGDPVSEAEFHRAYGLYDEAALLLKQALEKDPKRTDARVKLAEIYFEASKQPEFIAVATELKSQLPAEEWQKIALLGSQLAPDHELFKGGAVDVGGAVDLSFDEPAAAPAAPAVPAPAAEPAAPAADAGLDFKLEDVQLPEVTPEPAAPAAPAAPAGDALEFDLGDLSLETPGAAPAAETPVAAAEPAAPAATGGDELSLDLGDFDLKTDAPAGEAAGAGGGEVVDLSLDTGGAEPPAAGGDEASTKLDLARAYIDMGDNDMAKSLLNEVAQQGTPEQQREAQELLKRVPG